jgi:hypothetical protein
MEEDALSEAVYYMETENPALLGFWAPLVNPVADGKSKLHAYTKRLLQTKETQGAKVGDKFRDGISLLGSNGAQMWVPPKEWFSPQVQQLTVDDLLTILPPAEQEILTLLLGRAVVGRNESITLEGTTIEHTFRTMAIMVGYEAGLGKALPIDTPIATPQGWSTMGELKPGDYVFGSDGTPTFVVATTPVLEGRPVYRLTFDDGSTVLADENHQWHTWTAQERLNSRRGVNHGKTRTTLEIKNTLCTHLDNRTNHAIRLTKPVEYPEANLPIDPYVLGAWLGDGLTLALRAEGLMDNKSVPAKYLVASVDQRLALLQGLMDTDGTVTNGGNCQFGNTRKPLCDAVVELVNSLGGKASMVEKRAKLYGVDKGPFWEVNFTVPFPAFRLPRKLEKQNREVRDTQNWRYITSVEAVESVPVKCIQVSAPDKLYLAGRSYLVTHNSSLVGNIFQALEYCGYVHKVFRDDRPFGWGEVALANIAYLDDLTKDTQRTFVKNPKVKCLVSNGPIYVEQKNQVGYDIRARCVVLACTNHMDRRDFWGMDSGLISRVKFLYTYLGVELDKLQKTGFAKDSPNLRTVPHWQWLCDELEVDKLVLALWLLRLCADKFLGVTGYKLEGRRYKLHRLPRGANGVEIAIKGLEKQLRIKSIASHTQLLMAFTRYLDARIGHASTDFPMEVHPITAKHVLRGVKALKVFQSDNWAGVRAAMKEDYYASGEPEWHPWGAISGIQEASLDAAIQAGENRKSSNCSEKELYTAVIGSMLSSDGFPLVADPAWVTQAWDSALLYDAELSTLAAKLYDVEKTGGTQLASQFRTILGL